MWPWLWLGWGVAGAAIEAVALYGKRHPKDTLSQNLQAVLFVRHPVFRWVTLGGWALFSAWFADHIWG